MEQQKQAITLTALAATTDLVDTVASKFIPVKLEGELKDSYDKVFYPRRKATATRPIANNDYQVIVRHLAETSSSINRVFTFLRSILNDGALIEGLPGEAQRTDYVNTRAKSFANLEGEMLEAKNLDIAAEVKRFLTNVASGSQHYISESDKHEGGYDVVYGGMPSTDGGKSSALSSRSIVSSSIATNPKSYGYESKKLVDYSTALSLKTVETAHAIHAILGINKGGKATAHKRELLQVSLNTDFTAIDRLLHSSGLCSPDTNFFTPSVIKTAVLESIDKYMSATFINEPDSGVVRQFATYLKTQAKGQEEGTPAVSLPDINDILSDEAFALSPNISVSLSMHLPRELAKYITQATDDNVSMFLLHTWARSWSAGILRPKNVKGYAVKLRDIPRYVIAPSKTEEIAKIRKDAGYYVEPGKVDDDSIYVTKQGTLAYAPKANDFDFSTARAYEKAMEELVRATFLAGSPLDMNHVGLSSDVFMTTLGDAGLPESIRASKDKVKQFAGEAVAMNWDYNTIISVAATGGGLVSVNLSNANKPDALAIADYLGYAFYEGGDKPVKKTFAESIALMVRGSRDEDGELVSSDHLGNSAFPEAITNLPAFTRLLAVYQRLVMKNKAPDFRELVKLAASALGHTAESFAENKYDKGIYSNVGRLGVLIDDDLKVLANPDVTDSLAVAGVLKQAMRDASGRIGSNLRTMAYEEMGQQATTENIKEFFEDSPYYFVPSESRLADFGNLYKYMGGQIFLQVCKVIAGMSAKDFLDVDLEHNTNALNEGIIKVSFRDKANEVKPLAVAFASYVPNAEKIFLEAEAITASNDIDEDVDIDDIKVPGVQKGQQFFPHQVKSHKALRPHPSFAVLDIAPGGGKCVTGQTLIPTSLGLCRIDELWERSGVEQDENGFRELAVDVISTEGQVTTDRSYSTEGQIHQVCLSNGTRLEGLAEHKLYVLRGNNEVFVALDDIYEGDFISVVPTNIHAKEEQWLDVEGHNILIDVNAARLFGYFARSYLTNTSCVIHEDQHKQDILNLSVLCFQEEGAVEEHGDFVNMSLPVKNYLYDGKQIPICIRYSPAKVQQAYCCSLLDMYAQVDTEQHTMFYIDIKQDIIVQLHAMLVNLGIDCSIKIGASTSTLSIPLYRDNIKIYLSTVGTMSPLRESKIHEAAVQRAITVCPVAKEVREFLLILENILDGTLNGLELELGFDMQIKASTNVSTSEWAEKCIVAYYAITADQRESLDCLSLITTLEEHLKRKWLTVTSSKLTSRTETVYDLSVPGPHSYVLNAIMGHNTTIILTDITSIIAESSESIRPLVIAPDKLVKNWTDDFVRIVGSAWNIIPITNTVIGSKDKDWDFEDIDKLLSDLPKNTIVVTGINFLKSKMYNVVIGNQVQRVSAALELIKRHNFNYIAMDESHKAKNMDSVVHYTLKQIVSSSSVKYLRLATGTLISNLLTDVVGQTALYSSHVFRTPEEFKHTHTRLDEETNAIIWNEDTPLIARKKLARHASVISIKRKEWAFMLPNPVETFQAVSLTDESVEYSDLHQQLYDAVLKEVIEELQKGVNKAKRSSSSEETEEDESAASEEDLGDLDLDDSESSLAGMESLLRPYLQRLERILTDPLGDELGMEIFAKAGVSNYVSRKVLAVVDNIDKHFAMPAWDKEAVYTELTVVSHNGDNWLLRKEKNGLPKYQKRPDAGEPGIDETSWKNEPEGKVLVFCRYTRSVNAVYEALPEGLKAQALKFSGEEPNKWKNMERFKTDDKVQVLIANEQAISEGHNLQCFPPQTQVHIDAQRTVSIETLYRDTSITHVLSYNLDTQEYEQQLITERLRHDVKDTDVYLEVMITFKGENTKLMLTEEHPLFLVNGDEVEARDLKSGDTLITTDGVDVAIVDRVFAVEDRELCGEHKYDINVDINHNFFACTGNGSNESHVPILVHNCASRIIRVESPWAPGELDQSTSRIFRPDPAAAKAMIASGKPGELYREVIHLHHIVANYSLEIPKLGRLISKIINKSKFDEIGNDTYSPLTHVSLPTISMGMDVLKEQYSLQYLQGQAVDEEGREYDDPNRQYLQQYELLQTLRNQEFSNMRINADTTMVDITAMPKLKDSKTLLRVPLLPDQHIADPDNYGLIGGTEFLSSKEHVTYRDDPSLMKGLPVHTSFGRGEILSVTVKRIEKDGQKVIDPEDPIRSFRIQLLDTGETRTIPVNMTYIATNVSEEQMPKFVKAKLRSNVTPDPTNTDNAQDGLDWDAKRHKKLANKKTSDAVTSGNVNKRKRRKNIKEGRPLNADIKEVESLPVLKDEKGVGPTDRMLAFDIAVYNGYLSVQTAVDDPDARAMKKLGFKEFGEYAFVTCTTLQRFYKIIDYIEDNFELSNDTAKKLGDIQDSFEEGRIAKARFNPDLAPISTMKNFFIVSKRPVKDKRKEIRVYPIVMEDKLLLAVDILTCPAIRKHIGKSVPGATTKWQRAPGLMAYFSKSKREMKTKLRDVVKAGFTVSNKLEVIEDLKQLKPRLRQLNKG